MAPELCVTSVQSPSSSGTGSISSDAKSIRTAWPGSLHSDASWSSSPVSAPTQSFSTREHSRARSRRSAGSSSPETASSASDSAVSKAADEERPSPCSRSPSIVSRHGASA